MKRIACLFIALSFSALISSYTLNTTIIASEKKDTAKDYVCGMEVNKDKATKLEHNGKTYYFCSKHCEESFKKDPSKYLKEKGK